MSTSTRHLLRFPPPGLAWGYLAAIPGCWQWIFGALLSSGRMAEMFADQGPESRSTLDARGRGCTSRLNQAKTTKARNCTTTIMSKIFMPGAWSAGTQKSNEIN
jgi:hypothetical protein